MERPIRIAINGFGRIGRAVARQWMQMQAPQIFELVAVSDIAPIETCAYLLEFDSVYGPSPAAVEQADGALILNGRSVRFTQQGDVAKVDMTDVDVLFECTGKANTAKFASAGLRAGAKRVLISGPSEHADVTIVLGANDHLLRDQKIMSNASCTTNALAPLLRVLDDEFGVTAGHMTTIHCYTGSQPTVDAPRGDALERNRAAALSMVPTTTSATALIDKILPKLAGRVMGCAVRVPTASVSAVDLTCQLVKPTDAAALIAYLRDACPGVLGMTDRPLVSSDLKARHESLVIAAPQLQVMGQGLVRIFGWYDNEWGFSARMFDVAQKMQLSIVQNASKIPPPLVLPGAQY